MPMSGSAVVKSQPPAIGQAAPSSSGWTQDGHDAGRTGYTPDEPFEPWTLAWTWNGPDASGGTGNHFYNAPPEARTVTGGGALYAPAGTWGIYGLSEATGAPLWHLAAPAFNATPAYDPVTGAVFAGGADGNLYKIAASTGRVVQIYAAGSPINKAVLLVGAFAYVVTDSGQLHKVSTATMTQAWVYAANSHGDTPPSYSPSRDVIIYATADLSVHAIENVAGTQRWGVKPSPNPAQFPYTFNRAWPVIAEQHGIVFLRMQLDKSFMSDYPSAGGIYPNTNAAVRAYLNAHPNHKNLFALSLDDGTEKFIPAVGYGSTEDFINGAAYGVMGSQPVVKVWPGGNEVVYIHFRDGQSNPPDYRWDGNMGEMVLDGTTIPGMAAGDLRFIRMSRYNGYGGSAYVYLTDEQEPLTVAGNTIFQAHWGASESVMITDRSSARGLSYANPIGTTNHPTVIRQQTACTDKNTTTHWTQCGLTMYQDGRYWDGPGFWEYWNVVAPPGSPQPNAYSAGFLPRYTYVSDGLIVVEGNGGELFVLHYSGTPVPPATPIGMHVTGATTSSVSWGWSNPDPTANVEVSDGATVTSLAPGTASFAKSGIAPGGYACLAVAAWNAGGASAWSSWSCGLVVPITPTGLHVSGVTNASVSFAWSDPDASSAVALGVGTAGGTTYTALAPGTASVTKVVAAGQWACAQVAAYNAYNASPYSGWVCGLAVPNAPTNIHVTGHTIDTVSFGWVDSDPYSGIAVSNGAAVMTVAAGGTAYVQQGMANGGWACVSLAAYNASGASPWTSATATGWVCGQAGP
jgi:hypothetical protein